eukprot:gb/GEZN01006592.1/.p1 GENE.gb/GEZN01006592.1/~~gb/GEZN01006592.1/.p1  ORF type:complete len:502 (+),score=78.86 gb/GEZN01006592.1/:115-1506(+)
MSRLEMTDADAPMLEWELRTHALLGVLTSHKLMSVDQLRRGIETLPTDIYKQWSYYAKWNASIAEAMMRKGVFSQAELQSLLSKDDKHNTTNPTVFDVGSVVRVRDELFCTTWPKPHLRTPGYVFGVVGTVRQKLGVFRDPEMLGFGLPAPPRTCYRVGFRQCAVWGEYSGSGDDEVLVDIFESWLESSTKQQLHAQPVQTSLASACPPQTQSAAAGAAHHDHHHSHHHHHGHGEEHGRSHKHKTRQEIEERAWRLEQERNCPAGEQLHRALYTLLLEKGPVQPEQIRAAMGAVAKMGCGREGVKLAVKAWQTPDFKARLLEDGNAAAQELGIQASNHTSPTKLIVVENTPEQHNLVCCTLCSCYPTNLLGPSPAWYKSASFRARAVREPRKLLAQEFGTNISPHRRVVVHDSTADARYMVLPLRPTGTEGWADEALGELITRDSLIGVSEIASSLKSDTFKS